MEECAFFGFDIFLKNKIKFDFFIVSRQIFINGKISFFEKNTYEIEMKILQKIKDKSIKSGNEGVFVF